jgi:neutral ceramidase
VRGSRARIGIAATACVLAACAAATAQAQAGTLRAGVGRADITPPTGYYMMGWVDSRAKAQGQHTRLYARAIVLERDGKKVALVAEDLNGIPGGVMKAAADLLADRGFSERNVLDSASHTHAAPSGFYNYSTYNTVFMSASTLTDQNIAGTLDPQLYAFEVHQLATAIRRADDDLGPAVAGLGSTEILGLTQNRSLEAHLADHGIIEARGTGSVDQDPLGYRDTIDPEVNVLRVDKIVRRRRVPVGIWSTFANHGTDNPPFYTVYNADHHGSATRVVEATIRRDGHVPARQDVVNAYGNTDEGDQSSALVRRGPVWADEVGRLEAAAMLHAWRAAGATLSAEPDLDFRWNRICFCGQATEGGPVAAQATIGLPQFTGSEEGRGPLYDNVTHIPFEDRRLPVDDGAQGDKIPVVSPDIPKGAPLMALWIGDRVIVSIPGEMTVGMGRRVRDSVLAATADHGIKRVVLSGLANEYLDYFTTPEEYERQHYEGGATVYGEYSSNLLKVELTDLARRLVTGQPAPTPYLFDPRNGVALTAGPFPPGATNGTATFQPRPTERLGHATFDWNGGPRGEDRPVDAPFVRVERRTARRWVPVTDDLGLQILWTVSAGHYHAEWEIPRSAPLGIYRFVVTANRYRLESSAFPVRPSTALSVTGTRAADGTVTVALAYPAAPAAQDLSYPADVTSEDFTYHPAQADGGTITFQVNGRSVVVSHRRGQQFSVAAPPDATVRVPAGYASDRFGNTNGVPVSLFG